jgi:hypothetical protein
MSKSANNGIFHVTGVSDNGKIVQVLNPEAESEFSFGTFTLIGDLSPGNTFTVSVEGSPTVKIAGTHFTIVSGNTTATAANLAAVLGTISGITATSVANVVTVTANYVSANIVLSESAANATTSGILVGPIFLVGNFSAYSEVSEGDTLIVEEPFAALNQGQFRVIRRYDNSVWFENINVVEEEVTLPYNSVNINFNSSTSFKVNASNNSLYLNWNGIGLEPALENTQMGDAVTFGIDFNSFNRGDFMVLRSGAKLQQISQLTMPNTSQFTVGPAAGNYFDINDAGNVNKYRVWFQTGTNVAPASGGRFLVSVNISGTVTSTQVASATSSVLSGLTNLSSSYIENVITTTTTDSITIDSSPAPAPGTMPISFVAIVLQQSQISFIECVNPSAVNESAVFVSTGVLQVNRPQIQFYEYEATIANDYFVTLGDTLLAQNNGSYPIYKVVDQNTIIIDQTLISTPTTGLTGRESSVYVQEGTPYYGYKRSVLVSSQPSAPSRSLVVFDTNAQYSKIDEAAGVQINSLNKMDFNTVIRKGLDSYSHNTGLIAEANRIIYGDPRDPTTYPGVGAAGTDIFVREPLTRRIQVSINVRLNTGVPFAQTADQVRSSISSLINSNPIGVSIAISSIISVVNAISGLRAVSISSPQYDAANDLIFISPGEKARIIDPTTDISVSTVG